MSRRCSLQSIVKWTGLSLSALISITWLLSIPIYGGRCLKAYASMGSTHVTIWAGSIGWMRSSPDSRAHVSVRIGRWPVWDPTSYGLVLPSRYEAPGHTDYWIPLWLPLVISTAPPAFFWCRQRRQFGIGHCQRCGYDLTSITSGVCPECGTAVPSSASRGTVV